MLITKSYFLLSILVLMHISQEWQLYKYVIFVSLKNASDTENDKGQKCQKKYI